MAQPDPVNREPVPGLEPEPVPVDPIRRYAGYGFVAAMVLAPFIALALGFGFGLLVMAIALAATTYLVIDTRRVAAPERRGAFAILAALNAALALICLAGAISRFR
jgi:hypothetical protein